MPGHRIGRPACIRTDIAEPNLLPRIGSPKRPPLAIDMHTRIFIIVPMEAELAQRNAARASDAIDYALLHASNARSFAEMTEAHAQASREAFQHAQWTIEAIFHCQGIE